MAINSLFENIADAIRDASSSTDEYTPSEMPSAIRAISGGGGGDMYKSDYDPDNTVDNAGGIVAYVAEELEDYYTKTESDNLLSNKADTSNVYTKTQADDLLAVKANSADVYSKNDVYSKAQSDVLLAAKANTSDVYNKTETNNLIAGKADASDVYTKPQANTLLADKADSADTYTKTETNTLLATKVSASDVYNKTQADALLANKADADDVYTKTESDNLLAVKANSADVYTITEADDLLAAKTNISTITDAFDEDVSYTTGDYFIDNNIIYRVDVPCTGITPPNAEYYTPNKLTDFIKENSSQISTLTKSVTFTYDSRVNITSYSKANPYQVPSDGYINARANNINSSAALYVLTAPNGYSVASTQVLGSAGHASLYVRKGMYVYGNAENSGTVYYIPIE